MTAEQIAGLALAIMGSGAAGSWLTAYMSRKKMSADVTAILVDEARKIGGDLRTDLHEARERIEALEDRLDAERLARRTCEELIAGLAARVRELEAAARVVAAVDEAAARVAAMARGADVTTFPNGKGAKPR